MHYYVYNTPEDTVYSETPPRFTWVPVEKPLQVHYEIRVFRDEDLTNMVYQCKEIEYNFFTPDIILGPGVYYWCLYIDGEKILAAQRFTIGDHPVQTPLIPRKDRYNNIVAGQHPRIWLNKNNLAIGKQRVQGDSKEVFTEFLIKSVKPWLKKALIEEPQHYPDNKRVTSLWRKMYMDCQECLYAVKHSAIAYGFTSDSKYLENTKKWLLHIANFDTMGSTSRSYNDEASFRITTALAWGYDWIYDELSTAEKAVVRNALLVRGRELFKYVTEDICIHVKLLDSHGIRAVSMTLVPAALALLKEEQEAEDWLNYAIEYYMTLFTPWGGDEGGWAESPAYWQTGVSFVLDALLMIKKAVGIDIFQRPFFQNTGDYPLFTYCPDFRNMAFGDMSDLGDYPGLKAGYNMKRLSSISNNSNRNYYAWYYEQSVKRNIGTEGLFYNYGWWDFSFERLVNHLEYEGVTPVSPPPGIMTKWFKDIGWVLVHKDLADEENHIGFMFKSSPYGSVSHSHGDQNSFVLHAYGEPLFIQSGYYIGFWTDMHINWRRQTKSKNTILIDETGQFADLKQRSKAEELNGSAQSQFEALIASNGVIEEVIEYDNNVYIRGNATNAFKNTVDYLKNYTRHCLFVDGQFFIIVDEVDLEKPGTISWLAHGLSKFSIEDQSFRLDREKAGMKVSFVSTSSGRVQITQNNEFENVSQEEIEGLELQWYLKAVTQQSDKHRIITLINVYKQGEYEEITYSNDGVMVFKTNDKIYQMTQSGEGYKIKSMNQ